MMRVLLRRQKVGTVTKIFDTSAVSLLRATKNYTVVVKGQGFGTACSKMEGGGEGVERVKGQGRRQG